MEIQTVRGLVPAANVGHVDAHSHIWIGRGVSGAPVLADEEAARAELIAEGLWKQVTLGLDLVDVRDWHVRGGCGLRAIPTVVLPRLRREGASDEAVKTLGGGIAACFLGLKMEVARVKDDSR
jgi:predicted metal-dependent phosphotriesterase family hydrolase